MSLDAARRDRGRHRPRAVHRAARRRDHRQGDGAGAARPGGRHRRASTSSRTRCATRVGDRVRARRPPPRGLLRVVPAGAGRRAARLRVRGAPPGGPRRRARGAGDEVLLAGDGVDGATRRASPRSTTPSSPGPRTPRRASPRSSSWPRHASSARSSRPRAVCCRCTSATSDAEIDWEPAGWAADDGGEPRNQRPGRAHRADAAPPPPLGAAHRAAGVPAPVERVAVPLASSRCASTRAYFVAHVGRDVVGYAGLMMTVDDGHVTTIAVDPRVAPPQDRDAPAARARARGDRARRDRAHARGPAVEQGRAGAVPALRVRAGRRAQELLPGGQRGRAGHVGARGRQAGVRGAARSIERHGCPTPSDVERRPAVDLRSSASRRRATRPRPRSSTTAGIVRSSVVSSQVDLHARFGGVVPEIASRAHVELISDVIARGARRGGRRARRPRRGRRVPRARARRRAARRRERGEGARARADLPYVGVNHLEAHLYAAWLEDPDLEPPLAVLIVSGGHTLLVVMEDHGRYRVARPDGRRRRRRGVRQGRALPRARLPGRPGDRPARAATATRPRSASPGRCRASPTSRSPG